MAPPYIDGPGPSQSVVRSSDTRAKLVNWRPWQGDNSSLVGKADISFNDWVIIDIPIFLTRDGTWSVGPPSAPQVDAEGHQKLRPDGRRAWKAMMEFLSVDARERFQRLVLTALYNAGIGTGP
jgi:hypothetical protein